MTGSHFFIQKKDGTPIGIISYFKSKDCTGIGYNKDIVRIQAETHPDNLGSQRVLEKVGFTKEGLIRRSFFSRGV
jgi:RimJ/RimL family protein N-acetyltransferase